MKKRRTKQKQIPGLVLSPFEDDIQHYKQLFELSPNAAMVCGENGLLDFNPATLKLFGVDSRDAFNELHLVDLAPEFQPNGSSSHQLFKDLVQEVNSEGFASIECLCKKLNTGEPFPVEVVMSLLTFPDELIYHVTLIDLSHNQHWQNALQVQKEIVDVTSAAGECFITASVEGKITHINEAACRLTGWLVREVMGRSVSEVINIVNADGCSIDVSAVPSNGTLNRTTLFPHGAALTSKDGREVEIEGSVSPQLLPNSNFDGSVISFSEITQPAGVGDELQWHATHDPLTRLPNRTLLADRFKQAMYSANRHKAMLAVCMMDLDEFKPINDNYGHAAGDLLLIEVASRLKHHLRQDDTVARLGGDEFVFLIGDVHNKPELFQAIQRLRLAVSQPYKIDGEMVSISCSIGIALYPEDDVDTDTLLRHADQAMFVAKQAGRNRVHWFDVEQDQQASSSQKLMTRIEQALKDNEFELYYQPKVNMRSGDIVGMEALIRWNHPDDGLIPPLDFLPFVEQNDLIIQIGEWVMDSALTQLTKWQAQGFDWSVSVNIAAKHFHVPSFTSRIKRVLRRFPQLKPEKLEIEILESVALGDMQHVQTVIEECRHLGVRFALDDFGTGYSSLSYLKRLPADVLKIDQSFIRDILDDKEDLALVQAITSLAVTFNREVVAEGVETIEHGTLLMRLGCDVAQGYGIARPMPANKVAIWAQQFEAHPMWQIWSKSEWDLKAFPLLVAQHDIREWVDTVFSKIEDGSLPIEEANLTDESKCRFGIWYHVDGEQKFGQLDSFRNIDPIHRQLHKVGDEIIQLYADQKTKEVQLMCSQLHQVKNEMLMMLDNLQLEVFSE